MGPRKRSESLRSSGCFRLCNKIMTRSTGNFESQSCNVPQSPGVPRTQPRAQFHGLPTSPYRVTWQYQAERQRNLWHVSSQSSRCVWCVSRAVVDGICQSFWSCSATRIRAILGSIDCDSNLLGLRAFFSGRQIALDPEELVSRPLGASQHMEMRISTAMMAHNSGSSFPSGSGFEATPWRLTEL